MDAAATCAYYEAVAPFYDAELASRDDLPCWLALLESWRPRRTLEYGCGSGRVAVPLARRCAGWEGDVAGIDLSPAMLKLARRRWRAQRGDAPSSALHMCHGDMRRTTLDHAVDLVLFADDPLTHLASDDDLAATFRRVREQLRPGGRLVVEASLLPPEARGRSQPLLLHSRHSVPTPRGWIDVEQERRIDPTRRRAAVTYRYHLPTPSAAEETGAVIEAHFLAHYLDFPRLAALLRLAGCRIEECWSDFHFHPLDADAGMALITASRQ